MGLTSGSFAFNAVLSPNPLLRLAVMLLSALLRSRHSLVAGMVVPLVVFILNYWKQSNCYHIFMK